MDRNAPDHYIESTDNSAVDTEKLIQYCKEKHGHDSNLITPIITPRYDLLLIYSMDNQWSDCWF